MRRIPGINLILIIGSLVVILGIAAAVLVKEGKKAFTEISDKKSSAVVKGEFYLKADGAERINETDIVRKKTEYRGKHYRYNDRLSNYLFMGLDKRSFREVEFGSAEAGQTDSIFLISCDRGSGKTSIITIPRDTITTIRKYYIDAIGESFLTEDHISIAYGYGDGKHGSCKIAKEAVSNLLGQIRIYGYCAISLDALKLMAKDIDGIEVKVPDDSMYFKDRDFAVGKRVIIDEDNIESFLRTRDINTDNSALTRMGRQEEFMNAFFRRAEYKAKEDPQSIVKLYLDLKEEMVTDMTTDQFVELFADTTQGKPERWTIPGKGVATDTYDEYHIDQEALFEKMLETFCIEDD